MTELALPFRLAARMKELGHNWSDVAREIGVNESTVSRWRHKAAVPDASHYPAIARYLGVDEITVWQSIPATTRVRTRAALHAAENPLLEERVADLERIVSGLSEGSSTDRMNEMMAAIDEVRRDLDDVVRALQRNDQAHQRNDRARRSSASEQPGPPAERGSSPPPTVPRQKG